MITRSEIANVLLFALCLLCLAASPVGGQVPEVRVGIVVDGPWEGNEEIRKTFEQEITELLRGEFDVIFPAEKRIEADFTAEGIHAALNGLLADPEVDFVLALGAVVSFEACRRGELSKPVVAPFVIDPEVQGIPLRNGTSGTRNLSYVVIGVRMLREVQLFREIVRFKRLILLSSHGLQRGLSEIQANMVRALRDLGIEVEVVPVGRSAEEALEAIPADTEAVYVAPLVQLAPGEFDRLVAGLIERRLPSFSMWGRSEVERGVLAGLALDLDIPRLSRRVALNIQRILLGEQASSLPVAFSRSERLTINMATARAINVYPSWALMTEAELLHEERTEIQRQLSLASAVREAVNVNLDLAAADRNVAAGLQRVRRARAELLPQIGVSGLSRVIDGDRAQSSFGSAGRLTSTGTAAIQQLIYSEPVRANARIEGHLQTSREEERNQLRLDIVLDAAAGYLSVLRSKTVERIQKNNLGLTRTNLELARSRRALGASGPEEVYRWENQIANNRKEVIESIARRNEAEIALNRVLNRPLEESFATKETALDDPELITSFQRLSPYINNPRAFRIFRSFMVQEAFAASPELRRLEAGISAQERGLLAARRSFYMPELTAQADLTGITKAGAGSTLSLGELPPGLTIPTAGNVDWSLSLKASLPIFTSGARRAEVQAAEEEVARLRTDRPATVQRIEQRTRSGLHGAMASFAGIELAGDAAEAARKNLELVTDAYSRGLANIINLLDAQNTALVAELVAANAIYDFLIDLMNVQRAAGRFDFFVNPMEEKAFFERLDSFYEKEGYQVRKP
jgi:outer membrane protein TolC